MNKLFKIASVLLTYSVLLARQTLQFIHIIYIWLEVRVAYI